MSVELLHVNPDLIRFRKLCDEQRTIRDAKARAAGARRIYDQMANLIDEHDKLVPWLDRSLDWLFAHGDDSNYTDREATWLRRLSRYEAICDAIEDARTAVR